MEAPVGSDFRHRSGSRAGSSTLYGTGPAKISSLFWLDFLKLRHYPLDKRICLIRRGWLTTSVYKLRRFRLYVTRSFLQSRSFLPRNGGKVGPRLLACCHNKLFNSLAQHPSDFLLTPVSRWRLSVISPPPPHPSASQRPHTRAHAHRSTLPPWTSRLLTPSPAAAMRCSSRRCTTRSHGALGPSRQR
jgi:hypothetical protein